MHGFQLCIILDDIMTDWYGKAQKRCYMTVEYAANFRRKKKLVPNSVKTIELLQLK